MAELPLLPAADARRLFLGAQGLLDDPSGPLKRARLEALITRMGFLQVDSIQVVERAHHLTLASRLDEYRPAQLTPLLEGGEPVPKPPRAALGAPGGTPQERRDEHSGSTRFEPDAAGCRPPPQPGGTAPGGRSAASAPLNDEPHRPAGPSLRSIPPDVVAVRGGFGTGSQRLLFEHWTHDASLIPLAWYPHWKPRFRRDQPRIEASPWWQNLLGEDCQRVCAHVLERITADGPLGSADFDHPDKRGPWWGWKPQKAALDYLWRTGRLAIHSRVNFHKRYDLPDRVLPRHYSAPEPEPATHLEWACATAAERLVVFTPKELGAFWDVLGVEEAKIWCATALKEGRITPVQVAGADGSEPRPAFALADWKTRIQGLPEPPARLRLLSPFDPVIRDRARALRRFGFDYRFEAFVSEPKRIFGYYVLPILEGDRITGRADAKFHRGEGVFELKRVWWEAGVRVTKVRRKSLEAAAAKLAAVIGADNLRLP